MRELKKYFNKEKLKVGDIAGSEDVTYSPIRPIIMYRNDINGTVTMDTKVTLHNISRVDKIDGFGEICHPEMRITLETESFPCKECSIMFEDEDGFIYLPNVKKIEDNIGSCCLGDVKSDTEEMETIMVMIDKERVYRNAVNKLLEENNLIKKDDSWS